MSTMTNPTHPRVALQPQTIKSRSTTKGEDRLSGTSKVCPRGRTVDTDGSDTFLVTGWPRFPSNRSLDSLCQTPSFPTSTTVCGRKKDVRAAPRVTSSPCTLGDPASGAALLPGGGSPRRLWGWRLPAPRKPSPPQTGRQGPLPRPPAPLAVPKPRQRCTLKISTAGAETSHRANPCPAKDNGVPAGQLRPAPPISTCQPEQSGPVSGQLASQLHSPGDR